MYYYCPAESIESDYAFFPEDETRHLCTVRRASAGEEICFTDGAGTLYAGTFTGEKKGKTAIVQIREQREIPPASVCFRAGFSVPKQKRIDIVLEKGTELGVDHFIPLCFQRSEKKMAGKTEQMARMRRRTVSAAKQSQRTRFPQIEPPRDLAEFLAEPFSDRELRVFGDTEPGTPPLAEVLRGRPLGRIRSVTALVGPEGGVTDPEKERLRGAGFYPVSLGPAVLRVETAVLCFAAAIPLFLIPDSGNG